MKTILKYFKMSHKKFLGAFLIYISIDFNKFLNIPLQIHMDMKFL